LIPVVEGAPAQLGVGHAVPIGPAEQVTQRHEPLLSEEHAASTSPHLES
jgi:hypothetical protein